MFGERALGGLGWLSTWGHMMFAPPFFLGIVGMTVTGLLRNLPEPRLDIPWLVRLGGFMTDRHDNPPAKKFNAGQPGAGARYDDVVFSHGHWLRRNPGRGTLWGFETGTITMVEESNDLSTRFGDPGESQGGRDGTRTERRDGTGQGATAGARRT